jgi:hypothetical protein
LKETQTVFYALDLENSVFVPQVDDGFNLSRISVQDAMKDGTLRYLASTFNHEDQVIYDGLYDHLEPSSIPEAVLLLSKYQYQSAFVVDQEINLVACLTEFMISLGFK